MKPSLHVVSFPKSGTTWLFNLVTLATDSEPVPPASAGHAPLLQVITQREHEFGGPWIIRRSHERPGLLESEWGDAEPRVIYVYRDPRDVMVSGFFFTQPPDHEVYLRRGRPDGAVRERDGLLRYAKRRVAARWHLHRFLTRTLRSWSGEVGDWGGHIVEWRHYCERTTRERGTRFAFISYEALRRDTPGTLLSALRAVGDTAATPETCRAAARELDFQRSKRAVDRAAEGAQDVRRAIRRQRMFRKGVVGDWVNYLPALERRRIESRYATLMVELGYTPGA